MRRSAARGGITQQVSQLYYYYSPRGADKVTHSLQPNPDKYYYYNYNYYYYYQLSVSHTLHTVYN